MGIIIILTKYKNVHKTCFVFKFFLPRIYFLFPFHDTVRLQKDGRYFAEKKKYAFCGLVYSIFPILPVFCTFQQVIVRIRCNIFFFFV